VTVYTDRLGRARERMRELGVDVLLLSTGADLPYFTGYEAMPLERLTMLVVPRDGDPSARPEDEGAGQRLGVESGIGEPLVERADRICAQEHARFMPGRMKKAIPHERGARAQLREIAQY